MSWDQGTSYLRVAGPFADLRTAWEAAEKEAVEQSVFVDVVVVSQDEWIKVLSVDPHEEDSPSLLATEREGWAWWVGVPPPADDDR